MIYFQESVAIEKPSCRDMLELYILENSRDGIITFVLQSWRHKETIISKIGCFMTELNCQIGKPHGGSIRC